MGAGANGMNRQRAGKIPNGPQDDKGFRERLNAAAEAKKAALEKFRARAGTDDPAVVERQAARKAVSDAREVREEARKAAREQDAARLEADAAQRQAEAARAAGEPAA